MDSRDPTDGTRGWTRPRIRLAWVALATGIALVGTIWGLRAAGARRLRDLAASVAELEGMGVRVQSWEPTTWGLVRSKLRGDRQIGYRPSTIADGVARPVGFFSGRLAPDRLAVVGERLERFGRVTRFDRPEGHWWSVTPRSEATLRHDLPDATVIADPIPHPR